MTGQEPDPNMTPRRLLLAWSPQIAIAGPDDGDGSGSTADDTSTGSQKPETGAADQGQNSDAAKQEQFDAEYVKKLRAENASRRKREQELEARLAEIEKSTLTEDQKKARERKELEDEVNHLRYKARLGDVIACAVKHGAAHPDAVAKLIEDGEDDLDSAVQRLKKEIPSLFRSVGTGSADGGTKGKTGTQQGMNDIIRAAFNRTVVG